MKCIVCKHGNTEPGTMTATLERGDTTIVVKEVPADVCDNCGEEYLSQEISTQLLKQAEVLKVAHYDFQLFDVCW